MTKDEAIEILEKEKAYMLGHGGDRQVVALDMAIESLEQEPTEKCKWIKYDYRTMMPKKHDAYNPYWRIPKNRMDALKYCPYCGKEIEVEE